MTLKQAVVSELGEEELLAPDLIARSLVANDQAKYYLALLQTARDNADRPQVPAPDLKAERVASQLADDWLDDVVAGTRKDRAGAYRIPHGPEHPAPHPRRSRPCLSCLPEAEQAAFVRTARQARVPRARPRRHPRQHHRRDRLGQPQGRRQPASRRDGRP